MLDLISGFVFKGFSCALEKMGQLLPHVVEKYFQSLQYLKQAILNQAPFIPFKGTNHFKRFYKFQYNFFPSNTPINIQ
jgi:hypothetical protein